MCVRRFVGSKMEAPRYFATDTCRHTDAAARCLFPHDPFSPTKLPLGKYQSSPFCPRLVAFAATPSSTTHRQELPELKPHPMMFILGMGFVGQFFAQFLKTREEVWTVTGTTTSLMKKKQLEERGFDVCLFNANEPELNTLNTLKSYTHLLVSIPPLVGVGDPILQHEQLLRYSLMNGNLQWLGYLSSTSVYGDCGGCLVDEDYLPCPTNDIGKSRLAAEQGWLNLGHSLGISTQVFRLGGIYGPGRSAIDTIVRQRPLSKGQKMRMSKQYTSRVHVEDICQALNASIDMLSSRSVYNVVDDDPAPREDVFAYAEKLIEEKWPGMVKQRTSSQNEFPIKESNSRGEKRVSNARMKSELGVRLLHPSYRSGLESIVDQMQKPFEYGSRRSARYCIFLPINNEVNGCLAPVLEENKY